MIDDGCTDRTVEVAREAGVHHILSLPTNKGLAVAFLEGIRHCVELGADVIVNTDGDHQYPGQYVPDLIQPILDQHCVRCHGDSEPDGGLDFTANRADDGFYQSFRTLFGRPPNGGPAGRLLISVADRFSDSSVTRPKQFGSHRSPLIDTLLNDPLHGREVKLDSEQWYALVTWIDSNAPYYDRFIDKRSADRL